MATGGVDSLVAQSLFYDVGDSDPPTVLSQSIGDRRVELVFPGSAPAQPLSAVVFVIGVPDHASSLGPLMDLEQYRDWARLVAAGGHVGVLYSTSDPVTDLRELMVFIASEGPRLGIDPDRVALMAASANAPTALHYIRSDNPLEPRALVVYYGLMPTPDGFQAELLQQASTRNGFALPGYEPEHAYAPDLPIFAVRAGRDASAAPALQASIDRFAEYALAENLRFRLLNYPEGQHSFDTRDDTVETRNVIEETLRFLATHLN
jgi:dienelactone hydrolase